MKFVSPSVWLVARTEELQRIKKKILQNGRKRALKGPKIKISKNKKLRFFLMSQGVLCQKIRFLGQKLWPLAGEQTDTHAQTEVSITEYPIKASAFQASACDMSGPIYWRILSLLIVPSFCVCIVYVHLYVCCVCVFYLFFSSSCYLFIFQGDLVQRKCKNVPHNWSLWLRIYIFSIRFLCTS